jgi:transketolase
VKIAGVYSGLSDFKDGPTHHADSDIAIMRSLPNMTVMEAADGIEAKKMVPIIAEHNGPVYFRISRAEVPVLFDEKYEVKIGKGVTIRDGEDITLIASGSMVSRCLDAAETLTHEGVNARIVNMHTIKPLDVSLVKKAAEETGAIVTAEEHSVIGGLGSAVAEVLGTNYPVPLNCVGIADTFTETALNYEDLLDHYGMSVKNIVEAALRVNKRKK